MATYHTVNSMSDFRLLLLAMSVLAVWAMGGAWPNSVAEHKRALAMQADLNRLPGEGERCRLGGRTWRPPQAPQHQPFGVYPRRPAVSLGGVDEDAVVRLNRRMPAMAHAAGDPYGGLRRKARRIRSTLAIGGDDGVPATEWQDQKSHRPLMTIIQSSRLGKPISQARKEGRGHGGRQPRHADARGMELIEVPHSRHEDQAQQTGHSGAGTKECENSLHAPPRSLREVLTSLYFSRSRDEVLVVRPEAVGQELPRQEFTVEVWVKPEGGQGNPAIIAGLFDNCSHVAGSKGWSLGIFSPENSGRKDARFFFTLRTDRARRSTTVSVHQNYRPGTWTHLAATYDGQQMILYVDGVRVARHRGQSGALHSPFMASCRTLILGGDNSASRHGFRGHLGAMVLWTTSLPQEKLKQRFLRIFEGDHADMVFNSNFAHLEKQWQLFQDSVYPLVEVLAAPKLDVVSQLTPPPCGQTVCDNLELISNYNSYWPLRREKHVRYRVVNICEDDGGNPTVSREQITHQHRALSDAFARYNISWQLSVHEVRNSSLRHRIILASCESGKIGNEHCDPECEHPLTGYDGGDCRFHRQCLSWNKRDGICHPECNNMLDNFDDGDCCDPEVTNVRKTCFDPDSPERAYMSVKELKEKLKLNSTHYLNVYFASSVRDDLAGAATWPWDKEALSHRGGVVLNPAYYGVPGHANTMIHEVGHALGLYHVFKGVSEKDSCDDPCQETVPSMETGDLCADTAPTPKSKLCRDPDHTNDTCGPTLFSGTPYNNYMSYTDDGCTDSFTPNQVARMHCYLDLVYQRWIQSQNPTPIPMPPVVIGQSQDSITIHWLPPISGVLYERIPGAPCEDCAEDGTFRQYAHDASSTRVCDSSGYWTPAEAVGPPDVDQPCTPSLQAWSPELHFYHTNMTVDCPQPHGCVLELNFLMPVYPEALTLWTTYLSSDLPKPLSDLEVLTEHGESIRLGPMDTFCDMPLTVKLAIDQKVSGVRVYTFDERMEIDAALLTSKPRSPLCSVCSPVAYRVFRDPPFNKESFLTVTHPNQTFTDWHVTPGQVYRYQVQVEAGTMLGETSPPLVHRHGAPYCGDGEVTESLGEECDDGGLLDGDGCSRKCLKESGFNCVGAPSLCYIHDGDGVCESFEKQTSVTDCGFYTPKGYVDQWAAQAYSSLEDPSKCPVSVVTGEPIAKVCKPHFSQSFTQPAPAWFPCAASHQQAWDAEEETTMSTSGQEPDERVWLKVCFDRPGVATSVFLYLAYDGSVPGDQQKPTVSVHLTDMSGHNHSIGTHELSCQRNPLILNVTHNLSVPFYQTASVLLNFSSSLVGVSAVALRTSTHLNPGVPNHCEETEGSAGHERRSCLHRSCAESTCLPHKISHANVTCTPSNPGHVKCTVVCHRGFAFSARGGPEQSSVQREALLTCTLGRWDRSVTCDPIDCGQPDQSLVYYADFSCAEGTTFGKSCSFSCVKPAKLQGLSQWLTCMEDGLWSLPEAYCKLECEAPPLIANAKPLLHSCYQGPHDVGAICRYRCKPGYYVAETTERKTNKNILRIQCLEGGLWEEGSCVPVECDPPPPVFEGMYDCSHGFKLDSQCTLSCDMQKEQAPIICTKEGTWTEEFKLCEGLQGECPPPPSDLNLVEYSCDEGYGIGSFCTPSCLIPPSDTVVLPKNITADTMEHWRKPTRVESIVCTGMLRWHPDPEDVHCIPSCEPFHADGWCDIINNRAYCQYDGGDCCASTLSSQKVIPFAADCDQDECACLDPKAEENQPRQSSPRNGGAGGNH
ncbi:pappalysin-2 [Ambystoma mexicanum]|uniref:pappalysin-2 n=1 Tax=Ambystoma mexicanum TaxID=8296 RepID=UPI0037E6FE70